MNYSTIPFKDRLIILEKVLDVAWHVQINAGLPKCSGHMRIISFIEDKETIKKILVHLGLWETRNHDPPPRNLSGTFMSKKRVQFHTFREGSSIACICLFQTGNLSFSWCHIM